MLEQLPSGNFKQVTLAIYSYQEQKLREIAAKERLVFDELFRFFVEQYIHQYMVDHSEIRDKCFCNMCGKEFPKRKMHLVMIGYEAFTFCNHDYFSGAYKTFINQII